MSRDRTIAGIPVPADAGSLAAALVREMGAEGRLRSAAGVMRHAVYGEFVEEEFEEVRRRAGRIEAGIRRRVAAVLRGEAIPEWAGNALWIGAR